MGREVTLGEVFWFFAMDLFPFSPLAELYQVSIAIAIHHVLVVP